jgi:putative membrane protein
MIKEALLAYVHFIAIFGLVCTLVGELFLLRQAMPEAIARRLRVLDRWYGGAAGAVVITGLLRLILGLKGAGFYTHNPVFWTKMALFVVVGLLSIIPTLDYIGWNKRPIENGMLVLPGREYARVRGVLWVQVVLLVLIPLCATFMARGL